MRHAATLTRASHMPVRHSQLRQRSRHATEGYLRRLLSPRQQMAGISLDLGQLWIECRHFFTPITSSIQCSHWPCYAILSLVTLRLRLRH